jgi:hypothetical protein
MVLYETCVFAQALQQELQTYKDYADTYKFKIELQIEVNAIAILTRAFAVSIQTVAARTLLKEPSHEPVQLRDEMLKIQRSIRKYKLEPSNFHPVLLKRYQLALAMEIE